MKRKRLNTSKLITLLSLVLMIIIFAYILLNSSIFSSSNVKIEGNNRVSKEVIIKNLDIRDDKNIFKYNKKQMEEKLEENNYIESGQVKIGMPNKLHIIIIEKEIVAILDNDFRYTYIDKNGKFIQSVDKSDKVEKGVIVKINYELQEDKSIKFENQEHKKILLNLLECLKKENLNKKIKTIIFKNETIEMTTKENIKIILPNDSKLNYNISMLGSILSDLQGKYVRSGSVDFTLGNNPIYKP